MTSLVNIIAFGQAEAKCAAGLRIKLERQGTPIGLYDILIAASALTNNSTLVTHNTGEFERVSGLKIEDWYSELPSENPLLVEHQDKWSIGLAGGRHITEARALCERFSTAISLTVRYLYSLPQS